VPIAISAYFAGADARLRQPFAEPRRKTGKLLPPGLKAGARLPFLGAQA
jgi:hypothetical protein